MLDALVQGTTDPAVLAELARGRLRAKLPALPRPWLGAFGPTMDFWSASSWRTKRRSSA